MNALKKNASGKLVSYLTAQLSKLGYLAATSSNFDSTVETAVIAFQTQKGLTPDGIVGPNTWLAIYLNTVQARTTNSRLERNDHIMLLHPQVRKAVVATYVQLQAEQIPVRVFEAYRFPQRQEELFAQGRTRPGDIVTYTHAWSSYHQYGLAADFVLYIDGNWSWETKSAMQKQWWAALHKTGMAEGLMRLDFEAPHLQMAGTNSSALKQGIYPAGGDETWAENFNAAHSSIRPPLPN
jgi:hypothetical protein